MEDFNRDNRVAGLDDITPTKVFLIARIIINHMMNIILISSLA